MAEKVRARLREIWRQDRTPEKVLFMKDFRRLRARWERMEILRESIEAKYFSALAEYLQRFEVERFETSNDAIVILDELDDEGRLIQEAYRVSLQDGEFEFENYEGDYEYLCFEKNTFRVEIQGRPIDLEDDAELKEIWEDLERTNSIQKAAT